MTEIIQAIEYWLHDIGIWGYPLAIALMAAVAILPIPGEIPAAMNGMLFGTVAGTAISWTGAMIGALVSFELSKRFGRPLAERALPAAALGRVDGWVQAASWPALLIARFIPAVAFTALNWGAGLTAIDRRTFAWTTAVGILPGTLLFVSTGQGLARLYASHPLLTVALVLGIIIVVFTARRSRRQNATAFAAPAETTAEKEALEFEP